ncbi:MAG: hypothetical protein ACOYLX_04535, partial [Burkholderiaceae bacterium]
LAEEVPEWVFFGRDRIAEYGVRTFQGGLDIGVHGRLGELRLGPVAGTRDTFARTGTPILPSFSDSFVGVQFTGAIDQLDATDFPRDGYLIGLSARQERVTSDTDGEKETFRGLFSGKTVSSWGNHTVSASFRAGQGTERLALNQVFSLGGFMNLSGLQTNQLLGTSMRYASVGYQNQLQTLPAPLGRGLYVGVALEAGQMRGQTIGLQTENWIPGATAYLGAATAIGPIYLGYGVAKDNNRLLYLFLGRPSF